MRTWKVAACVAAAFALAAAMPLAAQNKPGEQAAVRVDGSSTVAPIMMAAAEMFRSVDSKIKVSVGISGTGGGFKKFLEEKADLRTDISDASRPIKPTELDRAKQLGVEFIELPVGYDGLAVLVNPKNTWCDHLTTDELKKIWEPGSKINNWKDVRAGFPDKPLKLYGPGTDSGTFDYFTETINGKEDACRPDFTPSEDDNVLAQGVAGDEGALGYFGLAYYERFADKLKLLGVAKGDGKPIKPTLQTVRDGTYVPLSRPLFIYVNRTSASRPEVRKFVEFLLTNAKKIVEHPRVGYVGLSDALYGIAAKRFEKGTTGTIYTSGDAAHKALDELYKASPQ